jgi:peptidoglycan L-alanyl-D-glutamate endopeptidase CwlK
MKEAIIFFLLILMYGIAIAIAGWFVLHVERRRILQQRFQTVRFRFTQNVDKAFGGLNKGTSRVQTGLQGTTQLIVRTSVQYKKVLFISGAILATPIIAAILIKPGRSLEEYADIPQTTDPVILALLQGEQLAPPAPLPPELFITQEVEAQRQELSGASREWKLLDNDFKQRLLTVFQLMAKRGYQMALLEGYRSPERQTYLSSLGS